MKKLQTLFLIVIILIVVIIFLNTTIEDYGDKKDSKNMVGEVSAGGRLNYKEFLILAENTVGKYYNLIKEKKYEDAYNLLTPEYRKYISSGDYLSQIEKTEINSFQVNDIVQITEYFYEAFMTINNEDKKMLIKIEDDKFSLSPDEFLTYINSNEQVKKSDVTCELKGYEVNLYKCIFNITLTNSSDKDVTFSDASITMASGKIERTINEDYFVIKANSTADFDIEFETVMDFPEFFEMERQYDDDEVKKYTFEL